MKVFEREEDELLSFRFGECLYVHQGLKYFTFHNLMVSKLNRSTRLWASGRRSLIIDDIQE